jgi:hypothetical protein
MVVAAVVAAVVAVVVEVVVMASFGPIPKRTFLRCGRSCEKK